MIKNNKFFIEQLRSVCFFGQSDSLSDLIKINDSFNIKSLIITSSHQSKKVSKNVKANIFNKIDNACIKLIKNKCDIQKTLFVSLGARYIFKKDMIEKFFLSNLVNFHRHRLPLNRGGGGYSWHIMNEDRIDNQLIHLINEKPDAGPIIDSSTTLFPSKCKIPIDFENYSLEKFSEMYKSFINKLKNGTKFTLKPQVNYFGNYYPRLNTLQNGFIDWNLKPYDLINFINAFDDPYPGAITFLNNGNFGELFLKKVQLHGGEISNHPFMTGLVTRHDKKWIVVSTVDKHSLLIEKVLNKKNENIISKIKTGDRFFTPINKIQEAKNKRVFYSSKGLES